MRLKRRADFLRAARGRKRVTSSLVLQCVPRRDDASPAVGLGFTASRKVGGAVQRNRAKRRLRAAAAQLVPELGKPGHDYVIVARRAVLDRAFEAVLADLRVALSDLRRARASA